MSQTPARIVSRNSARVIALQNSERIKSRPAGRSTIAGRLAFMPPPIKKRGGAYVDRRVKGNFLLRAYNGFWKTQSLPGVSTPFS